MRGNTTMISPKLAMLTAFMAAASVGAFAVPAMAQDDDGLSQNISRDNTITQFNAQSNEACTNTVVARQSHSDDQKVYADQSNDCDVRQVNVARQDARIDDDSRNFLANFNFEDITFGADGEEE